MKTLDITVEQWREYVYDDGFTYRIDAPSTLYTKDGSTSHRVVDGEGVAHYLPAGWRVIRWYGPVIA